MANMIHQWILLAGMVLLHPFYVSVIEINHNQREQTAEISIRIFTDDFEKALANFSGSKVDILDKKLEKGNTELIKTYLDKNMLLTINGKPAQLQFLGFEQQEESIWVYLEQTNTPTLKSLDVYCTLLHNFNNKQINIIHAKSNGIEKSFKLDYPNNKTNFRW
jgi:hypothetical protein